MEAVNVQCGGSIDYTPSGADVAAGQVVVQRDLVGVANVEIKDGKLGALAVHGVFDFAKTASGGITFAVGDVAYWDDTGNVAVPTPGAGNRRIGKVLKTAADADATVRVRISEATPFHLGSKALAGAAQQAGVQSWANPEGVSIVITRALLDVTTPSSGACTLDIGTTATSATTTSDNLIDGLSVAAAGLFSNLKNPGTNGKADQKLASGKWVTSTSSSGDATGLVATLYIHYQLAP